MSDTPRADANGAKPSVSPERILQLGFSYAPSLIIEAAIRNHVFDALDLEPKSIAQVASETGASSRGLRALMNALVGLEFLSKDSSGRYALAPESAAFLVSTKPSYRGAIFEHTSRRILPQWMQLADIVRTGKPPAAVNQEQDGTEFFAGFVEALFPGNYPAALALGDELARMSSNRPFKVLDIASGSGVWGIGVAQKIPAARITAVDFPGVLEVTKRVCDRHGLGGQLDCVAGDLLEVDYGKGYDLAILGHILHSEGESRSRRLLAKVFEALSPGGTIAIAEMIPNDDRLGPVFPLIFAVNMLVHTDDGDTFTFGEMSSWLKEAGFVDPRLLDAPSPSPLILATKPN